jgi:hypothetical protein
MGDISLRPPYLLAVFLVTGQPYLSTLVSQTFCCCNKYLRKTTYCEKLLLAHNFRGFSPDQLDTLLSLGLRKKEYHSGGSVWKAR